MQLTRRLFNFGVLASALSQFGAARAVAQPRVSTRLCDVAIAGGRYHALERSLPRLVLGSRLELRREPENPYDANAVAVHGPDGARLGYLPRRSNPAVAKLMDEGSEVSAEIVGQVDFTEAGRRGFLHTGFEPGDPRLRVSVLG